MTQYEHSAKHVLLKAKNNLEATPFNSIRSTTESCEATETLATLG